jgi:hypothetical protein
MAYADNIAAQQTISSPLTASFHRSGAISYGQNKLIGNHAPGYVNGLAGHVARVGTYQE